MSLEKIMSDELLELQNSLRLRWDCDRRAIKNGKKPIQVMI